jgi:hypothetical protein
MTTYEGFSYFITTYKTFASFSLNVEDSHICLKSIPSGNEKLRHPGIRGSEGLNPLIH